MQGHDIERIRVDGGYICYCVQCDQSFGSKRSDASFCSPSCRNKYAREEKQSLTQITIVKNLISQLCEKMIEGRFKRQYQSAARWIIKALDTTLDMCETDDYVSQFRERASTSYQRDPDNPDNHTMK